MLRNKTNPISGPSTTSEDRDFFLSSLRPYFLLPRKADPPGQPAPLPPALASPSPNPQPTALLERGSFQHFTPLGSRVPAFPQWSLYLPFPKIISREKPPWAWLAPSFPLPARVSLGSMRKSAFVPLRRAWLRDGPWGKSHWVSFLSEVAG